MGMAVPTLNPTNYGLVSDCNATTGWAANSIGTDTEFKLEGSASLSGTMRGTSLSAVYTGTMPTTDWTGKHFRIWFNCTWSGVMQTKALNGVRVGITGGGTTAYWNMLGNDNYQGGWKMLVVDCDSDPDSGSYTKTSVTGVGLYFAQTASPKNQDNTWWDYAYLADGYEITGGDATDDVTWESIYQQDKDGTSHYYGIVQKEGGVYFVNGELIFNDSTGDCYFKDTNKKVVFLDEIVASDLYKIKLTEGTGTTSFVMGEVSGTGDDSLGYNGCVVKSAETQTFTFDAADDISTLKLYGCTFDGGDNLYFGSTTTNLGAGGSTIHLVDNNFSNSTLLTRSLDGSATKLQLGNRVVGFSNTSGSVLLVDDYGADGNRIAVVNQAAFTSVDDGTADTLTVTDHDFSNNSRFLTIHDSKIWNVIDPVWSTPTSTTLVFQDFVGGEKVNEKYTLTVLVTQTDGSPLGSVEVYVYEGSVNKNLPNNQTTDATTGDISDQILKSIYEPITTSFNTETRSLDLPTTSDYLVISDTNQTGLDLSDALTLEAWVKPDQQSVSYTQMFFSKYNLTGNDRSYGFGLVPRNQYSLDLTAASTQSASITDANQTGLEPGAGGFTIECWARHRSFGGSGNSHEYASKWLTPNASYLFQHYTVNSSTIQLRLVLSFDGSTVNREYRTANLQPSLDTWYHVAFTYDSTNSVCKFYFDGTNEDSSTYQSTGSGNPYNGTAKFAVGNADSGSTSFDGQIDEVRYWSTVRTAEEIDANKHVCAVTGQETYLEGLWRFNNNYLDDTTNNNDLTGDNSPTFDSTNFQLANVVELWLSDDGTTGNPYRAPYYQFDSTTWNHVAVTWDSTNDAAKFYINGIKTGPDYTIALGSLNNSAASFEVSGYNSDQTSGPTAMFVGGIDDIRIWDDVRTATEIAENLYGDSLDANEPNLKARWRLENNYLDDTTNDNDLTAQGTPSLALDGYDRDKSPSGALDLDSTSSQYAYILDANQTGLDLSTALTIEAWVAMETEPDGSVAVVACKHQQTNEKSYAWVFRDVNKYSLDLTASNSEYAYILDANQTGLDLTGDITLEAWIYLDSQPGTSSAYVIVAKWSTSSSEQGYMLNYRDDSGTKYIRLAVSTTGTDDILHDHPKTLSSSTWYHVAATREASTGDVKFYVDGTQDGTTYTGTSGNIYNNTGRFNIGAQYNTPASFFNGHIDEVRVWHTLRTEEEINTYKHVGAVVGREANLQACWRFDNNYTDDTTNDNDLTASNSSFDSTNVSDHASRMELWLSNDGTAAVGHAAPYVDLTTGWNHIAVSWDGTTVKNYLNGKQWGPDYASTISSLNDSTEAFQIGCRNYSTTPEAFLNGQIQDVRVWSDVRTVGEIADNIHSYSVLGHEANLEGRWLLSNDYVDDSTNSNNLTAVNSPTFGSSTYADALTYTKALDLEASNNQYASITDANQTGLDITGDLTLEATVTPESYTSKHTLIAKSDGTNNQEGYAFYLHGISKGADLTSEYFSIADADQTGLDITGDLTIEAWFNPNVQPGTNTINTIVSKWEGTTNFSYRMGYADVGGTKELALETSSAGSSPTNQFAIPGTLTTGTWYHLAVTYDSTTGVATAYLDGTSQGDSTGTASGIYNGAAPFAIGADRDTGAWGNYIDGKVDDVRIWSVVRTSSEIANNTEPDSLVGDEPGLEGYWTFEQDFWDVLATVILDNGPNGNDATASTAWVDSTSTPITKASLSLTLSSDATNVTTFNCPRLISADSTKMSLSVTWDSSNDTARFFKDGVQLGNSMTRTFGSINNNTASLSVGAKDVDSTASFFFDGKISDVRVWNVTRTPAEISWNHTNKIIGNETGLVSRWMFDNDYLDDATSGNDLTAAGSPVFASASFAVGGLLSTNYGNFALKAYKFGYRPFATNIDVVAPINETIGLPIDNALDATSAAQAIADGTSTTLTYKPGTKPVLLLSYDTGTTAFIVGDVVTGASSGADGTVAELVEGDSTSGRILIKNWDGVNFTDNEALQVSAATKAYVNLSTGGQYPYSWLVDANSHTLQEVYDFMSAKFADATPDAIYESAIEWGEGQHALMLKSGANGYYTERNTNLTEGIWITDRGSGTVAYMESDNGYDYTPPVSVTFTLTGLQSGSEIRIYDSTTDAELTGVENSGTSFVYNYVHVSDTDVRVVIHHLNYKWQQLTGITLGNTNQSIPVQQVYDRNYSNPT